ncbi:MAG: sulfurtransferase-like selenium metabolism protein YedF [Bacillota bacterium]|nr:sulfurtransferase-like selenium metabolism protein YedF [Bacillota bacterium]
MKSIDCRGLNCPEPVIRTKKAISEEPLKGLVVLVDNETARENVLRYARNRGKKADWQEKSGYYEVTIQSDPNIDSKPDKPEDILKTDVKPVLFIGTNELGSGSTELGQLLMRNFIYTLTQREELPQAIVFMNSGVRLSIESSPVSEELKELEAKGVIILVCGTCLDYYQLKEEHRAGQVSNMYDISDLLLNAGKVISI